MKKHISMRDLLDVLIEREKRTSIVLQELAEKVDKKITDSNYWTTTTTSSLSNIKADFNAFTSNVYTKEETKIYFDNEYDYRKQYEMRQSENWALLEFIEKYCKYTDKKEVLSLYDEIKKDYLIYKKPPEKN